MLRKAVRQNSKATSCADASGDLRELLGIHISPSHLQKITLRVGREWANARDADVQAFQEKRLPAATLQPAKVATVMVDGGRLQTREDHGGRGVSEPGWQEVKVACCQTLSAAVHAVDPQPEPPRKFLDPIQAARLAAEMKARHAAARGRTPRESGKAKKPRRRSRRPRGRSRKLVRTVIASMANSDAFGWQVAAEVQRRGLDQAQRKGYICDGQKYNWTLYEMHLLAWGFIAILDFLHLLAYLYAAAQAVAGKASVAAWKLYERWLRWAWGGRGKELLAGLRAGSVTLGPPPPGCAEDDPRQVVADAVGYVENNRGRMDYPRYRCLGLPISSAPVESVVKQVNRRMKGTEKFWLAGGAEALLQVRAAYLSEDDRASRYWARPRPDAPAVGGGRLRQVN